MLGIRKRTTQWICGGCATMGICLATWLLPPTFAAEKTASTPSADFRMPALLQHLDTRLAETAPSSDVLDELREIYRENGLTMPPMTLRGLDRQQQSHGTPRTVRPIRHLALAAEPPPPAVDFAPIPAGAPAAAPSPVRPRIAARPVQQPRQVTRRPSHGDGLKGFCPVALKDQRKLIKARSEFSVTHQGRAIGLSSIQARTAFLAQPETYLPVAGGTDLVSASRQNPLMGQLDHATWYRGQLFLFATKANLIEFQKQPDRFAR